MDQLSNGSIFEINKDGDVQHGLLVQDVPGFGVGAAVRFYMLDTEMCVTDVERQIKLLKAELDASGKELLGGLMFSCGARGPEFGLQSISLPMMDANKFEKVFPGLPLLGFYAGGEIGPRAVADLHEGVLRTGPPSLQGFTAVFGGFICPDRSRAIANLSFL